MTHKKADDTAENPHVLDLPDFILAPHEADHRRIHAGRGPEHAGLEDSQDLHIAGRLQEDA